MSKVIGIDLGTTNSCVAVLEGGEPTVITNSEGMRTTPSVVSFTKSGERLVGETAKRIAITEPEGTVASIKRHMGEDYKVNLRGKDYTPQEISAMILQKLKADAEAYLGEKVTEAVITVPAPNRFGAALLASNKLIEETFIRRIRIMLAAAAEYGYKDIILGAWGCGAFGNRPEDVSEYFRRVIIDDKYGYCFENICFAIYGSKDGKNITVFRKCFG